MRKVIKPEDIRKDNKIVKIPDVEFVFETPPDVNDEESQNAESVPVQPAVSQETIDEITNNIREELAGELGRKKIQTQKECSILVRDAKIEAEKIIAQANAQKNQILNDANQQAQQLKSDAYKEGADKGFAEKKELLENLAVYISHCLEEIKRERNEFFEEYARELKFLAVTVCEKIISQKIEDDDMIMYGVIKDAVRFVRDTKWVKAEVSQELMSYIESLEKELQASGQNVEFIFSDIPKESCILNTSDGLVVASVSEQIKNLKDFINNLDKGDSDEG